MTREESINRRNYKRTDLRNYMDGDQSSRIDYASADGSTDASADDSEQEEGTSKMYFGGKGTDLEGISSLITDKSRVYKGGSWRDRAYWLVPGARRYLDERESTDDIGFRCAMTRLGSPSGR
jgi:hypothetical protein